MDTVAVSEEQRIYDTLLEAVRGLVENFSSDDDKREIMFNIDSDPFMVRFRITVRPEDGIFTILSNLEFEVPEENRAAYAQALCQIIYDELYIGNFDFDAKRGLTVFRTAEIYTKSLISKELCADLITYVYTTVSKYNERLFRLSRGESPKEN